MSPLAMARTTRAAASIAAACLALTLAVLAAPSASASPQIPAESTPPSPRVEPCIWQPTGVDLNQYFGVSTALVVPTSVGCPTISSGAWWSRPATFFLARTWEHVPDGYVPVGATPFDELKADLSMVRVIVDEGTPQEFTVERSGVDIQWATGRQQALFPDDPDWLLADIGSHVLIHPLSVGTHTVRGEFFITRPACDGTSSSWDSCIPVGLFPYPPTRTFTVAARN
ncbi:hypothetical protein [Microbacterium sp. 8M]|uniref:hypothetical protein n=1 Tax=Microbacterium sp. 8M TaxID=2653153 RepID=UPI00135CE579|nr:hypothetical protein [Microbacterium sp. 8M]